MARRTPQAVVYLRQLSKPELLKLASNKKLKIPVKWGKDKIVENLSTIVSANEVLAFNSKKVTAKTKEGIGLRNILDGKNFEDYVANIFTKKGFQCEKNVKYAGMEIDVYGIKKAGFLSLSDDEYIIVECKNKPKVIPEDFKKFIGNMNLLITKKGIDKDFVKGYLYTTGVFDKDVIAQARLYKNIQLKRVKLK